MQMTQRILLNYFAVVFLILVDGQNVIDSRGPATTNFDHCGD